MEYGSIVVEITAKEAELSTLKREALRLIKMTHEHYKEHHNNPDQ